MRCFVGVRAVLRGKVGLAAKQFVERESLDVTPTERVS